jgi:probable rRNA maturation factor
MLRILQQPECLLSVVFVGSARMRAINRLYRGRDYATDVLSFHYDGQVMDGRKFLGELVISPEAALAQTPRAQAAWQTEIRKLLVHGILHLLGYDHENDQGEMVRLQRRLLRRRMAPATVPLILRRPRR